jgi:hypothetical protein
MDNNLSLENEKKIIKLEGELTLLHHKIDTIRDNHLHHIDLRINNIYKVLWFVAALSITSLVNLVLTLIS